MPFKPLNESNKGKGKLQIKARAESVALAISQAPLSIESTRHNVANIFAADFGRDKFLKAMRLSKDLKVVEILQIYDHLKPSEQSAISLDHLCSQVDYPSEKLVGEAMSALAIYGNLQIRGIINDAGPAVIRAGFENAAKPEASEERRIVYQMLGLMPFDRPGDINIHNIMPKGTPRFEDAPDAAPSFMAEGEVIDNDPDVR